MIITLPQALHTSSLQPHLSSCSSGRNSSQHLVKWNHLQNCSHDWGMLVSRCSFAILAHEFCSNLPCRFVFTTSHANSLTVFQVLDGHSPSYLPFFKKMLDLTALLTEDRAAPCNRAVIATCGQPGARLSLLGLTPSRGSSAPPYSACD